MRFHRTARLAIALVVLLSVPAVASTDSRAPDPHHDQRPDGQLLQGRELQGVSAPGRTPAGAAVEAVVELDGPGLWDVYRHSLGAPAPGKRLVTAALAQARTTMDRRQDQAVAAVERLGAEVFGRYTAAFNGLHVRATPDQLAAIGALPGVARVRVVPIVTLELARSVPHIGATRAAQELGLDGRGSVVAVIDSGVDYTHAAFGGPGTEEAHRANDENVVEPGTFPTAKVVGGWDFAGQRYTPACTTPGGGVVCTSQPRPDPDPLDPAASDTGPAGHGTHVASIVAGLPVGNPEGDGVAAGVAPGASIVALKVFGNPIGVRASSGLSPLAIDWVIRHNLALAAGDPSLGVSGGPPGPIHVINLSLGSDWGPTVSVFNDVIDRAIESGVTVVGSAGNNGARPYITGSPAAAEHALSVGNSYAPGQTSNYIEATWLEDGQPRRRADVATQGAVKGETENGWLPPLPAGGLVGELAYYGMACNAATEEPTPSVPEQDVTGKIALIERGVCPFYDKLWNAQRMGAIGALVFSDPRPVTIMGCGAPSDCANGPDISGVMIERVGGLALRDLVLIPGAVVTVGVDAAARVDLVDTVSRDSSRGPARASGQIKPQITAPGMRITAAQSGSGAGAVTYDGTSMSGPAVSGVAALLWQRNRDQRLALEPLDISALAMNYASPSIHVTPERIGGEPAPIARQGAGRVDAFRSLRGMTIVRSAHGIAELSFGEVHPAERPVSVTRRLHLRNLGAEPKRYLLDSRLLRPHEDGDRGVTLSFSPGTLTVGPGHVADVNVTLRADPAAVRRPWTLRGTDGIRDEARMILHEVDGWVSVTEVDAADAPVAGGDEVLVPFHVLPRASSCAITDPAVLGTARLTGPGDRLALQMTNTCLVDATVETFALLGTDPVDDNLPGSLDIQAVGAAIVRDADNGDRLEFAVRTRGDRRMPADTDLRIYLDLNRNGRWDRVLFSVEATLLNENDPEAFGRWIVLHSNVLSNLEIGAAGLSPGGLYEAFDINQTVIRYSVSADDPDVGLGLDLSRPDLAFDVAVRIQDAMSDFPAGAGGVPLRDDAPDGFAEAGGPRYTFSRQASDCLTVVGPDGRPGLPGRMASFAIPAAGEGPLHIHGCASPFGPTETGVLFTYPSNAPRAAAAETVRVLVETNRPTVLLPYVARAHVLVSRPTPTVPEPTQTPPESPTPEEPPATIEPPEPTPTPEVTAEPTPEPTPVPKPTAPFEQSRFVITYLQCSGPDEYVRIENTGRAAGDLEGWTLRSVVGDQRFVFPSYHVAPNDTVRVHSGPYAPPTGGNVFRWTTDYVWDASGDEAQLIDPEGHLVDRDGC